MINETILLLTYNYDSKLVYHKSLKYIKNRCGIYLPWDLYLYEPLKKIFSKVILYDYLERRAEIGVKAVNEEIIDLVRMGHPKYVLWTSFFYDIQESTFDIIRNEDTRVVGLFFDDEWRFDTYSRWWIPYLDFVVTNARDAVPKYRELDARVILTIPNTGIPVDRDWSKRVEKYDVSFVGTRDYADRDHWITEIKKRNVPVNLFGTGWGNYVSFDEMLDIFKTSRINLNFSKTLSDLKKLQIKGRIFQVCLAGGFLLTEYAPGIEDYFELDKEIVCFQNSEEMIDKIYYYLNHDTERLTIAEAGWNRAIREYSSYSMIKKVFQEIEEDLAKKYKTKTPSSIRQKMPMQIRKIPSQYHFEWGMASLEEDYKGLWKDSLELSLCYNPFNLRARYYMGVSFFPVTIRRILIWIYKSPQIFYKIITIKFGIKQYLRKIKEKFTQKKDVFDS